MKRSVWKTLHNRLVRSHLLILLLSTGLITLLAAGTYLISLNCQAVSSISTGWVAWRPWLFFILAVVLVTALLIGVVFVQVRKEIDPLDDLIDGVEGAGAGEINSYTSKPDDPWSRAAWCRRITIWLNGCRTPSAKCAVLSPTPVMSYARR